MIAYVALKILSIVICNFNSYFYEFARNHPYLFCLVGVCGIIAYAQGFVLCCELTDKILTALGFEYNNTIKGIFANIASKAAGSTVRQFKYTPFCILVFFAFSQLLGFLIYIGIGYFETKFNFVLFEYGRQSTSFLIVAEFILFNIVLNIACGRVLKVVFR